MIDQTIFYLALPLKIITRKLSIPDSDASAQCSVFKWRLHLWTSTFMIHHSVNCHRWQLGGTYSQRGRCKKNRLKSRWTKIVAKRGKMNTKYFYFIKTYLYFDLPFLDWIGLTDGYWCRPGKGNSKLLIFVTLLMLLTICWLRLYDWWAFLKRQYTYNFRYYPLKTKPKMLLLPLLLLAPFQVTEGCAPAKPAAPQTPPGYQCLPYIIFLRYFDHWRKWKWHFPHSLTPQIYSQ